MDGASALFRKKLAGMARRAVRILQRSCRYLLPANFLHQIQDSLLGLPFFILEKTDFKKCVNVWDLFLLHFSSGVGGQ